MKKFFAIFALVTAFAFGASAQSAQSDNAGYIGYTFNTSNVAGKFNNFNYDKSTDAHGINLAYTRFFAGSGVKRPANTVGFTADLNVGFNGKNDASIVTVMGGLTAQARNYKYVQPYVRAMAGIGRQHVKLNNVTDFSDTSAAFDLGGGLAFNLGAHSRNKFVVGADYVNTGFNGQRQNGGRINLGFQF